ncbi:MAG: hypothetical protein NTZ50_11860, partial [Chloroflexi bacterium]|nr:hypothetical protein [Chloroflexota bacterium]
MSGRIGQGLQFVSGQTLSAPWQGGEEANTVGLWFKTSTRGRTLFTIGGDRRVALDATGNITATYDPGRSSTFTLINATQSTTSVAAGKAIDGSFSSYNQTNEERNPWWQADIMEGSSSIGNVSVHSIFDASDSYYHPFQVILYNAGNEVWRSSVIAKASSANPTKSVAVPSDIRADRVRVYMSGDSTCSAACNLRLAEVEIWAVAPLTLRNASSSSQTSASYSASKVNDGNLMSIMDTTALNGNWWMADIEGANPLISAVRVYNNWENPEELGQYSIVLYNSAGDQVWRQDLLSQSGFYKRVAVPNVRASRIKIEQNNDDGHLQLAEVKVETTRSGMSSIATSGVNYADDRWHHLMYVMGDSAAGQLIYIDGERKAMGAAPSGAAGSIDAGGSIVLGAAGTSGYQGFMDQVHLLSAIVSTDTAQLMVDEGAKLAFKFEELPNSRSFASVSGGPTASCTQCPTTGAIGKVGGAVDFTGTAKISYPADSRATPAGAFSAVAWVKAREWINGSSIITKSSGIRMYVESGVLKVSFPFTNPIVLTMTLPAVDQWNQIAAVNTGKSLQLFSNGSLVKSVESSGQLQAVDRELLIGERFNGMIDELLLYKRAQTSFEIYDEYVYQLGLIAERHSQRIEVDATAPTITVDLAAGMYLPNVDRVVSMQAVDNESSVSMAAFYTQRTGESLVTSGTALRCVDAVDGNAWCPAFVPRGEGRYTVYATARNAVGLTATSPSKTIYVDATAPQITVTAPPSVTRPVILPDGNRQLTFSGTVSDPSLANASSAAGSGVDPLSVQIELIGPAGNIVGGDSQRATITGTTWTVNYVVPEAEPLGKFTIVARGSDRVGNAASATRSGVVVDGLGATMKFLDVAPSVVTQTAVVSGVVSEIYEDGRADPYLPFEEITRSVGYVGRAASFNGNASSMIAVPFGRAITGTYSVAAWVKPNRTSGTMTILSTRSPGDYSFDLKLSNAAIRGSIGDGSAWISSTADVPFAYAAGTWLHVTYVVSETGYTIYVNGEQKAAGVLSRAPLLLDASHQLLVGAGRSGADPFDGMIDEVAVYHFELSALEVRRLAQTAVAGTPSAQVAFKPDAMALTSEALTTTQLLHLMFDEISGESSSSGFRNMTGAAVVSCSETQCPQAGAEGMRGSAALFDGSNDKLEVDQLNRIADRYTVAAWVRPDSVSQIAPIVYESAAAGNTGKSFRLQLLGGNQITASIGNGTNWLTANVSVPFAYTAGQWIHVAAVVSTTGYALYANGAVVGSGVFAAGSPLLADGTHRMVIGAGAIGQPGLFGALDEVRIYSRTLSTDEIYRLYAGRNPVLSLHFADDYSDASAWAHSATVSGSMQLADGQGIAAFDGVDDSLTITPSFALANKSWSVGAWVKRGSIGTADVIFGQGRATTSQGLSIGFNSTNRFACGFYSNDLVTSAAYTDLDWHYWLCTFDAASRKRTLYRDGVQVASDTAANVFSGTGVWQIGGTPWSTANLFAGSLDDVQVYPYTLGALEANALAQTGFRSAQLTSLSSAGAYGSWNITPTAGLEGMYWMEVRGMRGTDIDGTTRSPQPRYGIVDTLAPRVVVSRTNVTLSDGSAGSTYTITAQDMQIDGSRGTLGLRSSAACLYDGIQRTASVEAWTPWAGIVGEQPSTVEASYRCTLPANASFVFTVCDMSGNCTSASTAVAARSAENEPLQRGNASAPTIAMYRPTSFVLLTTTFELKVDGFVRASDGLSSTLIMVNDQLIEEIGYPTGSPSDLVYTYTIAMNWNSGGKPSPIHEGENVLQIKAQSVAGTKTAASVTLLVDSASPEFSFDASIDPDFEPTRVLTQNAYVEPFVMFGGTVTDANRIASVRAQVDDTVYVGGAAEGRWHVGVSRSSTVPVDGSGPSHHVVITLTDAAGWTSVQEHDVIIDTLAGDVSPTFIGADGVSFVRPDQDGIVGYYFGATHGSTFTLDMLAFTADDPVTKTVSLQAAAASLNQAQDGFASYGHLVVEDSLGNLSIYHSPISYTDNTQTPDYVGMHETDGPYQGKPYRGWMENGCSLLGADTRIAERAASGAALSVAQRLYATWSHSALRLTWSGADWTRDGDLFVYLDTVPDEMPGASYTRHGSNAAYDPYSATMTSTLMLLPVDEFATLSSGSRPRLNRMNADVLLWVEDNDTVHLLRWSDADQKWKEEPLPAGAFEFDSKGGDSLTEFSLPFTLLGNSVVVGSRVDVVAFASDDGALRTWAALPAANPVTAARVVVNAPSSDKPLEYMLTDRYSLSLADGDCRTVERLARLSLSADPGGVVLASQQDEMRLIVPRLSVQPLAYSGVFTSDQSAAGVVLSTIGAAHRSWLIGTYCPANRYALACQATEREVSSDERLSKVRDVEYPALLIGQRVTYTVHYVNELAEMKPYTVLLNSVGTSGAGTVRWDAQDWAYGCTNWLNVALPPQSAGELTFTG